ncbi:uncharacterized protein AB675_1520 [Cyphellophora attinorum]|uniref:Transcription factor domain-containing protein n=1 Tax=Cyphellophora attinorum TaxID=1664694 RepID=A0A0N1HKH4_9EURO|nr:uncharacterized protein AB675_1520 [Phialophora attinorum]KPI37256.1 hypothetical protein AB675_1520 [Phialophora attinorum]
MSPANKNFTFVVTNSEDKGTWTTRREEIWSQVNTHVAYAAHNKRARASQRPRRGARAESFTAHSRTREFGHIARRASETQDIHSTQSTTSDPYTPLEELVELLDERDSSNESNALRQTKTHHVAKVDRPSACHVWSKDLSQPTDTTWKTSTTDELPESLEFLHMPLHSSYARSDRKRSEGLNPVVQTMHHEAIQQTWPFLLPPDPTRDRQRLEDTLFEFESHSDAFYYCSLYVSSIQYRVRRRNIQIPAQFDWTCLKLRAQALRHLQFEINSVQGATVPDAILACVAALAAQEPQAYSALRLHTPRTESPLARYQALNLERSHRGKQHCHCSKISLALALFTKHNQASVRDIDAPLLPSFGTHFCKLPASNLQQLQPFMNLLPTIRSVTCALASHQENDARPLDSGMARRLIESANAVHYQILSLHHRPCHDLTQSRSTTNLLEVLRLATLIYSNLTLFPLGLQSGVPTMLACQLKGLLRGNECCDDYDRVGALLDEHQGLTLWILMMGAIGSLEDPIVTKWFTIRLKPRVRLLCSASEVGPILDLLQGYLWWDHIFASYFHDVWALLSAL